MTMSTQNDLTPYETATLLEIIEEVMTSDLNPPVEIEGEELRRWVTDRVSDDYRNDPDAWGEMGPDFYAERTARLVPVHRKLEAALGTTGCH